MRHTQAWIAVLMLMAAGAAAGLLWWIDPSQTPGLPRCPAKMLTGLDCPGCGSTRALHGLLHLRIAEAFHYNPLLVICLPGLAWWFAGFILRNLRLATLPNPPLPAWTGWVLLGVILAWWVGRNAFCPLAA